MKSGGITILAIVFAALHNTFCSHPKEFIQMATRFLCMAVFLTYDLFFHQSNATAQGTDCDTLVSTVKVNIGYTDPAGTFCVTGLPVSLPLGSYGHSYRTYCSTGACPATPVTTCEGSSFDQLAVSVDMNQRIVTTVGAVFVSGDLKDLVNTYYDFFYDGYTPSGEPSTAMNCHGYSMGVSAQGLRI